MRLVRGKREYRLPAGLHEIFYVHVRGSGEAHWRLVPHMAGSCFGRTSWGSLEFTVRDRSKCRVLELSCPPPRGGRLVVRYSVIKEA